MPTLQLPWRWLPLPSPIPSPLLPGDAVIVERSFFNVGGSLMQRWNLAEVRRLEVNICIVLWQRSPIL